VVPPVCFKLTLRSRRNFNYQASVRPWSPPKYLAVTSGAAQRNYRPNRRIGIENRFWARTMSGRVVAGRTSQIITRRSWPPPYRAVCDKMCRSRVLRFTYRAGSSLKSFATLELFGMVITVDDLRRFAVARSLFAPTTLKRALYKRATGAARVPARRYLRPVQKSRLFRSVP
jgi:hypothetical protein